MSSEMIMLIIGSLLALVNSLIGLALGHVFKSYAQMHKQIAENYTEIQVATTNLANLTEMVREHTETDRAAFDQVREQQREMHNDNRRVLDDIRAHVAGLPRNPESGKKFPMRPA